MKIKDFPAIFKTAEDGEEEGTFEAFVSVFGNVDGDGDRVIRGAFTDTLAAWVAKGDPIPVIWSHQWRDPAAHIGWADPKEVEETPKGLKVKGHLDLEMPSAATVHRLFKGRRVTQFSFAYDVVEDAYTKSDTNERVHELRKLDLFEVGPCLLGSNSSTDLLTVKDLKQGRSLSAKNEQAIGQARGLLSQATDLLAGVLSSLEEAEKSGDSEQHPDGTNSDHDNDEDPSGKSEDRVLEAVRLRTQIELEDEFTT